MHYPLTKIDNLFEKYSKYKHFSLIDIKNAFLSVALTERAKQRSAIVTPFGVFLPQRTPFGLKTLPAAFCYVMRIVLKELDFCSVYIVVCAMDEQDMTEKLIKLFNTLNKFNLKIQLSKVKFF
jgi:hypothetical protein